MTTITGHFATPRASGYLQQLCKHFGHKVEATFDERSGVIAFPAARATLAATDEALSGTLDAESVEDLARHLRPHGAAGRSHPAPRVRIAVIVHSPADPPSATPGRATAPSTGRGAAVRTRAAPS